MAIYKVYKDGEEINRIVANEPFVTNYCEANGYTFELEPMPEPEPTPEPETEDDVWEQLDAAYQEGVNSVE